MLLDISTGVCISHTALMNQAASLAFRSDDLALVFSTNYWISGLVLLISSVIKGFIRLITAQSFSADLFLDMIEAHPVRMVHKNY